MRDKIQFSLILVQVFLFRHGKTIIFASLIGFFTTLFMINFYSSFVYHFNKKEQKIGIVGKYTYKTLPLFIQNQLSLGLTQIAPNGEALASLADSWQVDDSGKNYIFYLRKDIFWHDGLPLIADDLNFSVKGAKVLPLDKYTLKAELDQPYAPLPVLMSQPVFRPYLLGLGIYKVISVTEKDGYLTSLSLFPQHPNLTLLKYIFYQSTEDAVLAFKLGEIDILKDISDIGEFKNWPNLKINESVQYDRYLGLFFNLNSPLFKEKEIRQAISYALPKFNEFEKAYTSISPYSWAYSAKIRLYNYDPSGAKKILEKSPLASSSSQLTISTYISYLQLSQRIADALSKIGLNVKIKVETSIPEDYQIFILAQAIPPDPDQYLYWQSTQNTTNITHYSNLKIDKLLEDGRKTQDQNTRKKIYADFQRYLVDDAPVLFLYYPKVYTVERN